MDTEAKTEPSSIRGYERVVFPTPRLRLPDGTENPQFTRHVSAVTAARRKLEPWTLVEFPGETWALVAKDLSALMRCVTWWRNIWRRRQLREVRRRIAAHFSPESVAARVKASQ